jgi:hypothetical protein
MGEDPEQKTRRGTLGVIVADANLDCAGSNFGDGTCLWQADGSPSVLVAALKDLAVVWVIDPRLAFPA